MSRDAHVVLIDTNSQFNVHTVTNDGSGKLYVTNDVRLRVENTLSPCTTIFDDGELILSRVSAPILLERNVNVYGKLTLLNHPSISYGKLGGTLAMHPGSSPHKLIFGDLTIESNGSVVLMYGNHCRWVLNTTQITMKSGSNIYIECPFELTGTRLTLQKNALFSVTAGNSVSNFSLDVMDIGGKFQPGIASVGVGLHKVSIGEHGLVRLRPYGEFGVNTLVVNGQLLFDTPVFIRGRLPAVSSNLTIGPKGRVELAVKSLPALSSSPLLSNGTSIVHAQDVTIAGTFLAKGLSIDPGWKEFVIERTGTISFDPVNWFSFDKIVLNGGLTANSGLSMKGLSQDKIPHLSVGPGGRVNILSKELTTVLCDRVTIQGVVRIGNLNTGSGWKQLYVLGIASQFHFETKFSLNIETISVSGLLQTASALGSTNPITGQLFTVLTGGTVNINYQGPPIGSGQGALNTTIFMRNVRVDGLFQLGSLFVQASDFIIGSSGRLSVNGGGCAGGEGPGAGISSSSGGSGASYGGRGGRGGGTRALKLPYGDIFTVGTWGSGGGHGSAAGSGGRGGGRLQMMISKTLQVNGEIQMNGEPGKSSNAGGGSGGSLWARAESFTGTGRIKALGGDGNGNGGGGAGGRINVHYVIGGFHSNGTVANGGNSSSENGGPGIVYLEGPGIRNLRVDNKGLKAMVK